MTLSLSGLLIAMLALGIAAFWYDSMRVREHANRIAANVCRRHGLQLLDGTVALAGLRPRLQGAGLRLRRTYVFDYTVDGEARSSGFIILIGRRMEHVGLQSGHAA